MIQLLGLGILKNSVWFILLQTYIFKDILYAEYYFTSLRMYDTRTHTTSATIGSTWITGRYAFFYESYQCELSLKKPEGTTKMSYVQLTGLLNSL
jgi:hypothetical protein